MLNIESLILAARVTDISLDDRTSPPAPPPSLCGPRSIYTFTHLGFVSALTSDSKFATAEMLPRRSGGSCATDDKSLRLWTACDCTPLYMQDSDCTPMYMQDNDCTPLYMQDIDCTPLYMQDSDCTPLYMQDSDCTSLYMQDRDCTPMYDYGRHATGDFYAEFH